MNLLDIALALNKVKRNQWDFQYHNWFTSITCIITLIDLLMVRFREQATWEQAVKLYMATSSPTMIHFKNIFWMWCQGWLNTFWRKNPEDYVMLNKSFIVVFALVFAQSPFPWLTRMVFNGLHKRGPLCAIYRVC